VVSEPPPDTQVTQGAPLTRVTTWISPWGTVIQAMTDAITHKAGLSPKEEWIGHNKKWRDSLPKIPQ
jgi:hypothetical protein